jgi:hypothetical protein
MTEATANSVAGKADRQALTPHYHGNLSLSLIGEKLCRSVGTVKLLMFWARQALKQCLSSKWEDSRARPEASTHRGRSGFPA